ncbi:hypothetical protein IQ02_01712 [Flavobacterium glaciei]|uniref:Uncharacterized protein n=1 Tax=Flavobacterium glaciei TaxID=386300 RepID=A0A562PR21_9FLAO|nr:hypothetical protein DFR66_1081 [Flavobacterium glaciei]TWI46882.1 hypothetical protein IQ02_01712 [Flavobacterium glaciei]
MSDQTNGHTIEGIDKLRSLVEDINTCLFWRALKNFAYFD